jgi:asparagine synthetase B (glutamine-hydrolysing)
MNGLFLYVGKEAPDSNRIYPFFKCYQWIKNSALATNQYVITNFFISEGINGNYFENNQYCIFLQGYLYINNEPMIRSEQLVSFLAKGIIHLINHIETGIFNIVLFDKKSGSLTLINDRFGLLPLYCYTSDIECIISSRIDAIIGSANRTFEINPDGIKDLLTFGYLTGHDTLFKEIQLVNHACILKIDLNNFHVNIKRYWQPSFTPIGDQDILVDNLYYSLKNSVNKLSLLNENRKICSLSGGMDSRTIYILHESPLDACTSGFSNSSERKFAKMVTEKGKKGKHLEFKFSEEIMRKHFLESIKLTEGMQMMVASFIPHMANKLRDEGYRFRYDGYLGGDLLGGSGFCKYQRDPRDALYDILIGSYQTPINTNTIDLLKKKIAKELVISQKKMKNFDPNKHIQTRLNTLIDLSLNESSNLRYIEDLRDFFQIFFAENRRRFRFGSLQHQYFYDVVCPFVDYNVFDVYLRIPPKYRSWRRIYNKLYNKYFDKYKKIPTTSLEGLNTTMPNIIARSNCYLNMGLKQMGLKKETDYVDFNEWLTAGTKFRNTLEAHTQFFNHKFPDFSIDIDSISIELLLKTASVGAYISTIEEYLA